MEPEKMDGVTPSADAHAEDGNDTGRDGQGNAAGKEDGEQPYLRDDELGITAKDAEEAAKLAVEKARQLKTSNSEGNKFNAQIIREKRELKAQLEAERDAERRKNDALAAELATLKSAKAEPSKQTDAADRDDQAALDALDKEIETLATRIAAMNDDTLAKEYRAAMVEQANLQRRQNKLIREVTTRAEQRAIAKTQAELKTRDDQNAENRKRNNEAEAARDWTADGRSLVTAHGDLFYEPVNKDDQEECENPQHEKHAQWSNLKSLIDYAMNHQVRDGDGWRSMKLSEAFEHRYPEQAKAKTNKTDDDKNKNDQRKADEAAARSGDRATQVRRVTTSADADKNKPPKSWRKVADEEEERLHNLK